MPMTLMAGMKMVGYETNLQIKKKEKKTAVLDGLGLVCSRSPCSSPIPLHAVIIEC